GAFESAPIGACCYLPDFIRAARHSHGGTAVPSRHSPAFFALASASANSYLERSSGDCSSAYFRNHQARPIVICDSPASRVVGQSGLPRHGESGGATHTLPTIRPKRSRLFDSTRTGWS